MNTRSDERRVRQRRVFRLSLGIAAAVHVAVIGWVSWSLAQPKWTPDQDSVQIEAGSWAGTPVDVFFGPPRIFLADGTIAEEPPERILEAERVLGMPPVCLSREIPPGAPGAGEVRLTVNAAGRIDAVALARSTGDACWDAVAMRVAGDLWYRWLPNDGHPAPVELIQPVLVGLAEI